MKKFLVSYDLRKPGQNYQSLWDRLADWKAKRILQSVWVIEWDGPAVAIRDDLLKHVDTNDVLVVAAMTGEAAWRKLEDGGASLRNKAPV